MLLLSVSYLCQYSKKDPLVPDLKYPAQLELFGEGSVSPSLYERDIAISPERDEMIYTMGNIYRIYLEELRLN